MADWDGSRDATVYRRLVKDIEALAGAVQPVQFDASRGGGSERAGTKPEITSPAHTVEPLSTFCDTPRDGGKGPEMVVIPAGSFWMGSPEDEPGRMHAEGPRRQVEIPQPFALGKTAVTFADYDRFAEVTGRAMPDDSGWGRGNRPVITIDWNDAVAYAEWLSEQSDRCYRLPSEAEWEYACRAGTETPFWTGTCIHTDQANYHGNYDYGDCGAKTGVSRHHPVPAGSLPANPWGLHEVTGNVWEWVQDCWHTQL